MDKETQIQDTDIAQHALFKLINSLKVNGQVICNLAFEDDGLHVMVGAEEPLSKVIDKMAESASRHLKIKIEPKHLMLYLLFITLVDAYNRCGKPDMELEALKSVFKSEYKLK